MSVDLADYECTSKDGWQEMNVSCHIRQGAFLGYWRRTLILMKTFLPLRRAVRLFVLPLAFASLASFAMAASDDAANTGASTDSAASTDGALHPYQPRFGRTRPVVAVIGENAGTELTDFVIPYGVLKTSGAADVLTVATKPGNIRMRPALVVQPDATIQEFDQRFPDGADYVIVPAIVKYNDATLLRWVKAQAAKGSTIMSICDGAAVVAGTGLMDGRRATAHWASERVRRKKFPQVNWIADVRYTADGKIVSTAGISASFPASLALVEAIAGRERALAVATELGVSDWNVSHRTAPFRPRFGVNLKALISTHYTNTWFHSTEMIGQPVTSGVDEIALAFVADAYSRTGRSMVHAISASTDAIRSRHGLMIVPDTIGGGAHRMDRTLPTLDDTPSGQWLAKSIDGIMDLYGRNTAYGVALDFEYPMIPEQLRRSSSKVAAK